MCVQVEQTAERVAHNQSTFRDANERIEQAAEELAPDLPAVPFICECPDRACTEIVRLGLTEYETVRARGEWFFVAPGHEVCVVDGETVAKVKQKYGRFTIMEKLEDAGAAARNLDPRS